jgi:hypothetical protein
VTETTSESTSFRSFLIVWAGQLVSITGTTLTGFALQIFVFVETGSVTKLAFVSLAFVIPSVVFAPTAGSIADRFDRRLVMLISDAVAATATIGLLITYMLGPLQLWQILVATFIGATANTFQDPAWNASIPILVPKAQLGRANGLLQLNQGLSIVLAPAIAGALIALSGVGAVLLIDAASFAVGVVTLAVVRFPQYERTAPGKVEVLDDLRFAWRYLRQRRGLLGLLWIYAGVNFLLSATAVLQIPLIISFSTETAAGVVLSIAGVGAVAGSLLVSALGTPKRLIRAILLGILAVGVLTALTGVRESLLLIAVCTTLDFFLSPIINSSSQVVWQTKVAEGVQGRVFALRYMISRIVSPLAILIAGPIADGIFGPLLEIDGGLATSVGSMIGTGPGRGIGFIFILGGIGTVALAIAGWSMPRVRNLETKLPDLAGRP